MGIVRNFFKKIRFTLHRKNFLSVFLTDLKIFLEQIKMSEEIQNLLEQLKSPHTKERLVAANSLAEKGNDALADVTDVAMNDPDYKMRRIAAYVIGKIGNDESIEVLIDLLGDDTPDVRKSSAQALNRIGEAAVPALIRSLGNISKDVRATAVWSLSKLGAIAAKPLAECLSSEVKDVRASAVWALSNIGTESLSFIDPYMTNPEKNTRESAIWCMAKFKEDAMEYLANKWNVELSSDPMEGEKDVNKVNAGEIVRGGINSIKAWIKFMIEAKEGPAESAPVQESESDEPQDF